MVKWSNKWLISFNAEKCKVLYLGKNNKKHKYLINNNNISTELTETVCEKDLGVNVDQLLSFEDHVFITIKKARSMSGLLIRTMDFKCPSVLVPLYISKVRPLLEYGNVVWCPYKKKGYKGIEKVQQHFTTLGYQINKAPCLYIRPVKHQANSLFHATLFIKK